PELVRRGKRTDLTAAMGSRARPRALLLALAVVSASATVSAASTAIDRAVARFDAPETGGALRPQFVFERELAFEARLEALADADRAQGGAPYLDRHVR